MVIPNAKSRSHRSPRLQQSGWSQVCSKTPSAPPETRFLRVEGGWKPLTTEASVPWNTHLLQKPSLSCQSSYASLQSAASSHRSAHFLSISSSTERPSRRRSPLGLYSSHQWPQRALQKLKEARGKHKDQLTGSVSPSESSESSGFDDLLDEEVRGTGVPPGVQGERRVSLIGAPRPGRRVSVGSTAVPQGRRISAAGNTAGLQGLEALSDLQGHIRGCPEAIAIGKGVEDELRLSSYVEALLSNEEIQQEFESQMSLFAEDLPNLDAAALRANELESLRELATLFVEFDRDLTGFIFQHDWRSLLRRTGRSVSAIDVRNMLDDLDDWDSQEGTIDFLEVLQMWCQRRNCEKLYLQSVFGVDPDESSAGSSPISTDLRELVKSFEVIGLQLPSELVRRSTVEFGLHTEKGLLKFDRFSKLFLFTEMCRAQEKQRCHQRAGFSIDQVLKFQNIFEMNCKSEAYYKDMFKLLKLFGIAVDTASKEESLKNLCLRGRYSHDEFTCWQCLHLARRFLDKLEMDELNAEYDAADDVGIYPEELQQLRQFFQRILAEANSLEFNYHSLVKAVRIMGATITMETNAELETLFRRFASPSSTEGLQLRFSDFLHILGELFSTDFAQIATKTAENLQEQEQQRLRRTVLAHSLASLRLSQLSNARPADLNPTKIRASF